MNTALGISLFVLSFTYSLTGKEIACEGYYITFHDDTIKCTFLIPDTTGMNESRRSYYEIQWKIDYIDADGETRTLYPQKVKGYVLTIAGKVEKYLTRKNDLDFAPFKFLTKDYVFLRVVIEGTLNMFEYYDISTKANPMNPMAGSFMGTGVPAMAKIDKGFCFQHGDRALFRIKKQKKDWAFYIPDYPELATRIKNGEFAEDDSKAIVIEYNAWKNKKAH